MRSLFSLYGWDQQPPQAFMAGVTCHPSIIYVLSSLCMVGINNLLKAFHGRRHVPSFYNIRSLFSLYGWDQQPPKAFIAGVTCHPSMRSLFSLGGWDQQSPEAFISSFHGRRYVTSFYAFSLLSGWLGSTTP
jgi:hypothetical protein